MAKITIWKTLVVEVEWNNPPKIPIPLFKNKRNKLSSVITIATTKIVIVALEYKIDLSCLDVMDVDNNNKTKDKINMYPGGKFEFPLLMH